VTVPAAPEGGRAGWRRHAPWLAAQVALWVAVAAILRLALVPGESCPAVGRAEAARAIDAGADWLVEGQRPDGRFRYGYLADEGRPAPGYNVTRHAGVMDALYRVGRVGPADAALGYVEANLIHHDGWTAFAPSGEDANVGAAALLAVALVHRREATGDRDHDALLRGLGRFIVAQQRPDGSILQYWSPATDASVPGVFGKFSTGEAFYALALMDRAFPGQGWLPPARRTADYLSTRRDAAEGHAFRQSDHWAAYGLATLAPAGLTEAEAGYARWLAGYFGFLVRLESQRVGRPLNPFSESGASLGTVGEGTTALWRLAGSDPRLADLRDRLGDRSACLAGILVERQVARTAPDPGARGAWFADGYTQMDDQQHAVAALLGALPALG
jgi:hypothetical protein